MPSPSYTWSGAYWKQWRWPYILTPDSTISPEDYSQMIRFANDTFGDSRWSVSHVQRSFFFETEEDRIVFKMAFS